MTPRLLATCILAVIAAPFVLAAYAFALTALFGAGVVLTAADLLGGDEGNVPEWVKEA